MLAALVASSVIQGYEAARIASFGSNSGVMAPYTWVTTILDDDTVAGYHADSTGVHGESFLAKPFAVVDRKVIWLPIGAYNNGHVFAGSGDRLIGDVDDGNERPALWQPHPKLGWSKAKLTILSQEQGWAAAIAPDSTIWMRVADRLQPYGRPGAFKVEKFDLYGLDVSGRLYGNRFEGYGEGMSHLGLKPGFYDGGKWTALPAEGSGSIARVNRSGVAVGRVGLRAVMWKGGKLSYLADASVSWSEANSINDAGAVVGSYTIGRESRACVWNQGRLTDLSSAASGERLTNALAINSRGDIVAETLRGAKLYLLRPK